MTAQSCVHGLKELIYLLKLLISITGQFTFMVDTGRLTHDCRTFRSTDDTMKLKESRMTQHRHEICLIQTQIRNWRDRARLGTDTWYALFRHRYETEGIAYDLAQTRDMPYSDTDTTLKESRTTRHRHKICLIQTQIQNWRNRVRLATDTRYALLRHRYENEGIAYDSAQTRDMPYSDTDTKLKESCTTRHRREICLIQTQIRRLHFYHKQQRYAVV
jgi:hypothetical protein